MKIDRIIFSLNDNKIYSDFWNINSRIYNEFYNIKPTLVFYGSNKRIKELNLSEKYGDIINIDNFGMLCLNPSMDCFVPWTMFYATKYFKDDICMTSGIDQIPLSGLFFDFISEFDDQKYIIPFSDAYQEWFYPSSHHVARGVIFDRIFNFSDNFEDEINKMMTYSNDTSLPSDLWGLDERYSSGELIKSKDSDILAVKDFFYKRYSPRKLDRSTIQQYGYDKERLKRGYYSEFHSLRPFDQYKNIIQQIVKDKYEIEV